MIKPKYQRSESEPGNKGGSENIRFDMHLHSCYSSDASTPIETITGSYQRTGILPLVCDHNTIAGSKQVYKILRKNDPDITTILAEEIMTSDGEIIGLFLQEEIFPFLSAEETFDAIHDQGGLALIPHPFCTYRSCALKKTIMEKNIDRIDIIEGFNSRILDDWENALARGFAERYRKPISAGSDAHTSFELGRTFICCEPFSDPQGLMKALPDASVHYTHTHPAIHSVTRLVKAGRRLGLVRSP